MFIHTTRIFNYGQPVSIQLCSTSLKKMTTIFVLILDSVQVYLKQQPIQVIQKQYK